MLISIITPTYNRASTIERCINSAIAFSVTANAKDNSELILIDDASKDDTVDIVKRKFADEIDNGWLKITTLPKNVGFLNARNEGVKKANGKWIVFLDSDDELVPENAQQVFQTLDNVKASFFYFRCKNGSDGKIIGKEKSEGMVGYESYINNGTPGEAIPIILREVLIQFPYDEDMRGSAGLTYARILKKVHYLYWSNIVARVYHQAPTGRLTQQRFARSCYFARGNRRYLIENWKALTPKNRLKHFIKMTIYSFVAIIRGQLP